MNDNKLKSIIASLSLIIFCIFGSVTLLSGSGTESPSLKTFTVDSPNSEKWQNNSKPKHLFYGRSIVDKYSTFSLEAREYPVSPEPVESISSLFSQVQNLIQKRIKTQNNERYEMTSHSEVIREINKFKMYKISKKVD